MYKKVITSFAIFATSLGLSSCYNSNYQSNYKKANELHSNPATQIKAGVAANKGTKVTRTKQGKKITYTVFGRSYNVLRTSQNYHATGLASWYGKPFHHRYTSSGERYNMFSMTAAHKTLPLSTYVMVTNLRNHKKVVVKINDRGPFVGSRLIDLSYAAAKKLGMVGLGVAEVSITALSNPTASA